MNFLADGTFAKHVTLLYCSMMSAKGFRSWIIRHPLLLVAVGLFVIDIIIGLQFFAQRRVLTVAFLDVGQGDAVFIQAPNGNQLLYDAGPPSGALLRSLSDVMPFYDRSIDVAVLSHPDMDHVGGFLDVFSRFAVSAVLLSGANSENGIYDEVVQTIAGNHTAHFIARKGMQVNLGDGVVVDVLYPDRDTTRMETNEASIVLRIHYGETAFLLSGDLPSALEEYVVAREGSNLHANVIKLGHHGSRTSTSPLFLVAVHPDIAVVSAGLNNRYGHPHKEVLDELKEFNIPALSTATEGSIIFESDGSQVLRK